MFICHLFGEPEIRKENDYDLLFFEEVGFQLTLPEC